MECLVAFVVLFVLPLAVAGVLLGWRAARVARRLDRESRAELARLRERIAALEGGGEVARAASAMPTPAAEGRDAAAVVPTTPATAPPVWATASTAQPLPSAAAQPGEPTASP